VGRPVNQGNAIAEFRQIQCGPDAADTSPYDQSFAGFTYYHKIPLDEKIFNNSKWLNICPFYVQVYTIPI
jgi:hypothetical protein